NAAMSALTRGSAQYQPNSNIRVPAVIAPNEPNRSPTTCKKALLTFKFPFVSPFINTYAAVTLTVRPTTATTSLPELIPTGGCWIRSYASQKIAKEMTASVRPLMNAASISTRWYPYVLAAEGGRAAIRIAVRLKNSAAASLNMCPASDNNAKLPVSHPPMASTTMNPNIVRNAINRA